MTDGIALEEGVPSSIGRRYVQGRGQAPLEFQFLWQ